MGSPASNFKLLALIWLCSVVVSAFEKVNIKNGTITGMLLQSRKGRDFAAFRGVPYALPPIGPWRFQPPQPSPAWENVRYTNFDKPHCIQKNVYHGREKIEGDEDCLYLNIYTPKVKFDSKSKNPKYPVMVYFHGGSWSIGSGNSDHHGPNFLLDYDVVLVTVNYRLGAFGFLSTGDKVIPGNMGLKDQVQSLQWVQENIGVFGGDPNSVTIFGSGTGGASVHYLMISPLAKGLFHRAISQSGTVRNPWAFNTPKLSQRYLKRLSVGLSCLVKASEKVKNCLIKKNAKDFVAVEQTWTRFDLDPIMPFRPVVEPDLPSAFLTQEPVDIIKAGKIADVPWLVGLNSHEGAFRVASIYGKNGTAYVEILNNKFDKLAPIILTFGENCKPGTLLKAARKIRKFYLADSEIHESTRDAVVEIYSDALFTVGIETAIREHTAASSSPVYYYHLAHQSNVSFTHFYGDRDNYYGVAHGDEIQYLFSVKDELFRINNHEQKEATMIEAMTSMWYNFAKTGNPTPAKTPSVREIWKPVQSEDLEFLLIRGPKDFVMSKSLYKKRLDFWASLHCEAGVAPSKKFYEIRDEL